MAEDQVMEWWCVVWCWAWSQITTKNTENNKKNKEGQTGFSNPGEAVDEKKRIEIEMELLREMLQARQERLEKLNMAKSDWAWERRFMAVHERGREGAID